MPSSRSVAVRLIRSPSASSSTFDRIGIVVFFSTTPCERLSSRTRSDLLTLNSIDLRSCPAKVKKEGSGTVPAKKLLDYVRLLPDAELTVKFLENHWANLTCGRSKTRMAGMSRESFPELPQMPEKVAEIPVKLLSSMIERTAFAISMEESRFTLNGALLLLKPESMAMVATDGHRLAFVESGVDGGQI